LAAIILPIRFYKKGYEDRKVKAEKEKGSAENEAKRIVLDAEKNAEGRKREIQLEVKEEVHKSRTEIEREIRERRAEIQKSENRLVQKEENLDKKIDTIENKSTALDEREKEIAAKKAEVENAQREKIRELERISGVSQEEAKSILLTNLEEDIKHESAILIRNLEEKTKDEADKKAKQIVLGAIQRCAADHTAETTITVVQLPNDDMKGRIIGREGRNIKSLETLTGVDLIIDDTPEAVVLSGFDPIKREIARIALEKLILDGRIHPARVEELVEKAKKEVDVTIKNEGERATFETGVQGLNPELVKLLGRLRFRTSYGQNVLNHSIEVSHLAGLMAAELGCDITLAKRAGLLHDIGKSIDHETEGSHITIGGDIAKRNKESYEVINAIMAHHGDVEPEFMTSVLVQAADAISASRPGARRETLESYIKRLEKLEEIANSFPEVEKSYAIQAGREIRIMVKPESMTDDDMPVVCRNIAKKIEEEMNYPGQIKINLIRETRCTDYAK
jgi:ribonuclease Y